MVKSQAQWKWMGLVAGGKKKVPGLSKEQAKEFLSSTEEEYKDLPKKVKKKK